MPSQTLSVVICTRNRLSSLRRCFEALASVRTHRAWELVIVNNGSTDGTKEYLDGMHASPIDRTPLRTVFEARPGLGLARNSGWRAANGNIIAFTDDDCYVAEDYVDSILEVFEEDREIGFLGGRVLLYDSTDYRITIQESTVRLYFEPRTFLAAGVVQGANMAFKRSTLERIGGFDERLGAGTRFPCEDVDAVAAALWAGIPGVYDPRPVVHHHHGRKTEREVHALMRSYAQGRGAYFAKYIMKKASRAEYLRAWICSARGEFTGTIRSGRFPQMQQSFGELSSGLRYLFEDLLPGPTHGERTAGGEG